MPIVEIQFVHKCPLFYYFCLFSLSVLLFLFCLERKSNCQLCSFAFKAIVPKQANVSRNGNCNRIRIFRIGNIRFFVEKKEQVLCNHFFKTKKLRDYRALVNWLFEPSAFVTFFCTWGNIIWSLYCRLWKDGVVHGTITIPCPFQARITNICSEFGLRTRTGVHALTKQNPTPPLTRDVCSSTPS